MQFKLGEPIDPQALKNCRALIHCAYDFSKVSWKDIYSTNVRGSELLLHAAQQAGVERLMFISTISAFTGCRSLYGKGEAGGRADYALFGRIGYSAGSYLWQQSWRCARPANR